MCMHEHKLPQAPLWSAATVIRCPEASNELMNCSGMGSSRESCDASSEATWSAGGEIKH